MSLSKAQLEFRIIEAEYVTKKWRFLLGFCIICTAAMVLFLGADYLNPPKTNQRYDDVLVPNAITASTPILIFTLWRIKNSLRDRSQNKEKRKRFEDLKARINHLE